MHSALPQAPHRRLQALTATRARRALQVPTVPTPLVGDSDSCRSSTHIRTLILTRTNEAHATAVIRSRAYLRRFQKGWRLTGCHSSPRAQWSARGRASARRGRCWTCCRARGRTTMWCARGLAAAPEGRSTFLLRFESLRVYAWSCLYALCSLGVLVVFGCISTYTRAVALTTLLYSRHALTLFLSCLCTRSTRGF